MKRLARILATLLFVTLMGSLSPAYAAGKKTIKIGWTSWSDAEFVTKLAKDLIQSHYGYDVKLVMADVGIQYQGVKKGDLDAMLMAWLPDTHRDYFNKVRDNVYDLGPLYTGAKLGWVVPDYIPKSELNSIEDLKKSSVADKLGDKITGIDPGAGLMRLSGKAIKDYGLSNYQLIQSSGAAMTAQLARAERSKQWIVVTGWTPHWMFGKWKLRFLQDPKGVLGGPQHIDALVRSGFTQDYPEVAAFLARMYVPLKELQAGMFKATEYQNENKDNPYELAIQDYIKNHPARVNYWLTGEMK